MESNVNNTRTRMNVSITAKGLAQWDCTCEYDTPELTEQNLANAIALVRKAIADAGLKEAGAE